MMHSDLVGLPALIVMMTSFALGVLALIAARRRRTPEARGSGTRSRRSLVGILIQGSGMFVAGTGPVLVALPAGSPRAVLDAVAVAVLMALAISLFARASRAMGANWSIVARTRDDHQLVQSGPFAYVRHPIYTALAAFMIAMAIAYGHVSHLWVAVPLYLLGTWLRIVEEERLLRAMFGPAYDAYAARVKRFMPGVF